MKRIFDVILVFPTLIMLIPVFAIVSFAIRIDSSGPALFRQIRVGRGCTEFELLKFRSMQVDADKTGAFRTAAADPRVTRVGRIIRRTSIDELPQLLNVLIGDMSLVGPRPDVPMQQSEYSDGDWKKRHRVRPGITGLAQVEGRSIVSPARRLELDLKYVDTHSFSMDLKIIARTFIQVLAKGGN